VRCRGPLETQELIDESLRQLDIELQALPSKPTYDEAVKLNSPYVQSNEYRLRFLRCDLWDAKKAALRLERNLDFMKKHFGPDALLREIYISDLDNDEIFAMRSGCIQILSGRDTIGRRILARFGDFGWCGLSNYSKVSNLL
jgi:hypothetical protein